MRHQWLTPTILGCVATLAIAVSGCGEGTAEIVQGDPTIVENIGTQQHGDVEYIESTDALLQRMDMTRIVTFSPDTPFTGVLLNVAAEQMPRMEYAYYRLDGTLSPFQELVIQQPESKHTDASIGLTEMGSKLLIKFGEGAETVTFIRAEFVNTSSPEGDIHLDDDVDVDNDDANLDDAVIRLEASRSGRYVPSNAALETSRNYRVRYDDAPSWNPSSCGGSFRPGSRRLADYLVANFDGARSYGGYACRQNTANRSKMSVHGTGRAIDLFVPLHRGDADNDLGDPIANWLITNAEAIGIQYIVWDRTSWNSSRSGTKHRSYGGPHPHHDHLHIELNRDGGEGRTPWFGNMGAGTDPGSSGGGGDASCSSRTLGRSVPHGEAVQMSYAACGGGTCNWAVCNNGSWDCTPSSALGSVTTHSHAQCAGQNQPSGGGSNGGGTSGGGSNGGGSQPTGADCSSRTLGRSVPTGSCVQMNYNSCSGSGTCQYAECQDGAWICTPESNCSGQKFPHADCGPPPTGRECWSKTLGQHVPDGECVQMPYEACGSGTCSWAVCDDGAWSCTGQNSCGGTQHGHTSCGGSTTNNNSGGNGNGGTANLNEIGNPAGTYWITYYYKSTEASHSGADNTPIYDSSCNVIKQVPSSFASSACIEGSGKLEDGRVINYKQSCSCSNNPCSFCWEVVDSNQFPWGKGNRNNPLVPLRSLAVDTRIVSNGTLIYLQEFDGVDIPRVGELGGFKHDGCFRADDVGGAIVGDHFDVFAGTEEMHQALEGIFPTRTRLSTWVHANEHCAHLNN
ncbi:MAG: 3D domain-containing protein [Myxococcota bacterium]|nr:3D domain-containing protein [Myxococcota bacterium]